MTHKYDRTMSVSLILSTTQCMEIHTKAIQVSEKILLCSTQKLRVVAIAYNVGTFHIIWKPVS